MRFKCGHGYRFQLAVKLVLRLFELVGLCANKAAIILLLIAYKLMPAVAILVAFCCLIFVDIN